MKVGYTILNAVSNYDKYTRTTKKKMVVHLGWINTVLQHTDAEQKKLLSLENRKTKKLIMKAELNKWMQDVTFNYLMQSRNRASN
jgi:hypothetical protein